MLEINLPTKTLRKLSLLGIHSLINFLVWVGAWNILWSRTSHFWQWMGCFLKHKTHFVLNLKPSQGQDKKWVSHCKTLLSQDSRNWVSDIRDFGKVIIHPKLKMKRKQSLFHQVGESQESQETGLGTSRRVLRQCHICWDKAGKDCLLFCDFLHVFGMVYLLRNL